MVIRNQVLVIRGNMLTTAAVFGLALVVQGKLLNAKDCGTHGIIYPIEEEDPISFIQNKLKQMERRGELEVHNQELQWKTKASVERPKPVEGISKATKYRVFYFDPTYVVKEDLKDHTGRVFAKKGSKINPLETVSLSHALLFFDGDDEDQKAFAKSKLQEGSFKLILVTGEPLSLSKELDIPVYFDQRGTLTQKLGIKHVPALVIQEKKSLRIEELCPSASVRKRVSPNKEELSSYPLPEDK